MSIFCGKRCQDRKDIKINAKASGMYGKNALTNQILAQQGVDYKSSTWQGISNITSTLTAGAVSLLNPTATIAAGASNGGGSYFASLPAQQSANSGFMILIVVVLIIWKLFR